MRFLPILVTMLLLAVSMPARSDAGGPGDAPGHPKLAPTLVPGTYAGDIGSGNDSADWYRVEHPAGKGVTVTLTIDDVGHYHLVLLRDDGSFLKDLHVTPHFPPGNGTGNGTRTVTVEALGVGGGAVRVGITDAFSGLGSLAPAQYAVTFEHADLPDLAVTDLRVQNVASLHTDHGPVYTGTQRRVEVDVQNLGAVAGSGYLNVQARSVSDGRLTPIGTAYLTLGAGEGRTFAFRWNGTGTVGDAVVEARVFSLEDADGSNDARTKEHYVLVGGTGRGVTAGAATGACLPFVLQSTCGFADADPTPFLFVSHSSLAGYAFVSAARSDSYAYGFVGASAPLVSATATAYRSEGSGTVVAVCAGGVVSACRGHWLP